jgi:hypothetical protein
MNELDQACVDWGYDILAKEDRADWTIEFSTGGVEGIVLFKNKVICIHWEEGKPDYALMIHEIAHVVSGPREPGESPHDSNYAHVLTQMIRQYFDPKI